MSDRTDSLVQALFNKPSLQDCSLQQVDYLAHQYPYFNTAQLLLLQKAGKNSEVFTKQLQRTALHFSNPLHLHYWLQPELIETEIPSPELFEKPIPEVETLPEKEEPVPAEEAPQHVTDQTEPVTHTPEDSTSIETGLLAPSHEPTETKTEAVTAQSAETAKQPEPVITFEPYHTVDYFASQGIRLSKQEASNDQLGKQVKSFTDWLKTMKRLPETSEAPTTDTANERKVENLAAHSLDAADVVTESMAEVWIKQGNRDKARDVYRKLSLHNPAKSAYFAAKIASLK